jgi:hypothetical protein
MAAVACILMYDTSNGVLTAVTKTTVDSPASSRIGWFSAMGMMPVFYVDVLDVVARNHERFFYARQVI